MAIIHPEVIATPDCPTVQIRQSWETVDFPVVLNQVLQRQGWGLGTYFHVQFIDHERTKLLREARFLVTGLEESLQVSEANIYQPMTKSVTVYSYRQIDEWWASEPPILAGKTPMEVKWNVGKTAYDIVCDGIVLVSVRDKERAQAIADGREPLPEAA